MYIFLIGLLKLIYYILVWWFDFIDCTEVGGEGICCQNHPELGRCLPGHDDDPENDGKCWTFCINQCNGGVCKNMGNGNPHQCHCLC
ncbi:hypothetical protein PTKIN_Ptkin12aG0059600 [Pterospermum kingtungense]